MNSKNSLDTLATSIADAAAEPLQRATAECADCSTSRGGAEPLGAVRAWRNRGWPDGMYV
jgi:hypothetical protein